MHVCIVGTGASGWIACNHLKNLDIVKKITIIGSSEIPPIGVGESNVMAFNDFIFSLIENNEFSYEEFIKETDAAIKYGVMYKNWSKNDFIHYFKTPSEFDNFSYSTFDLYSYQRSLGNKDPETFLHTIMGKQLFSTVKENNLLLNQKMFPNSYHFDAALFISFFKKIALKNYKVSFIDDKVVGGKKIDDSVKNIKTKNDLTISADFFIFATGDAEINEKFLGIKYKDYSDLLLTNKAVVYPLPYKDKEKQMHPYTIAKTMKNGWRWITPTWSRIGTGYVFSDKYISEEDAMQELKDDIGDQTISPFVVKFEPKHNEKELHENWCTLGLASGFLEPLDAPGLSLTINSVFNQIPYYLSYIFFNNHAPKEQKDFKIKQINDIFNKKYDFWCAFIFSQYKTCFREDTKFWQDVRKIHWDYYESLINNLDE
jgi:tryptophan halogenase